MKYDINTSKSGSALFLKLESAGGTQTSTSYDEILTSATSAIEKAQRTLRNNDKLAVLTQNSNNSQEKNSSFRDVGELISQNLALESPVRENDIEKFGFLRERKKPISSETLPDPLPSSSPPSFSNYKHDSFICDEPINKNNQKDKKSCIDLSYFSPGSRFGLFNNNNSFLMKAGESSCKTVNTDSQKSFFSLVGESNIPFPKSPCIKDTSFNDKLYNNPTSNSPYKLLHRESTDHPPITTTTTTTTTIAKRQFNDIYQAFNVIRESFSEKMMSVHNYDRDMNEPLESINSNDVHVETGYLSSPPSTVKPINTTDDLHRRWRLIKGAGSKAATLLNNQASTVPPRKNSLSYSDKPRKPAVFARRPYYINRLNNKLKRILNTTFKRTLKNNNKQFLHYHPVTRKIIVKLIIKRFNGYFLNIGRRITIKSKISNEKIFNKSTGSINWDEKQLLSSSLDNKQVRCNIDEIGMNFVQKINTLLEPTDKIHLNNNSFLSSELESNNIFDNKYPITHPRVPRRWVYNNQPQCLSSCNSNNTANPNIQKKCDYTLEKSKNKVLPSNTNKNILLPYKKIESSTKEYDKTKNNLFSRIINLVLESKDEDKKHVNFISSPSSSYYDSYSPKHDAVHTNKSFNGVSNSLYVSDKVLLKSKISELRRIRGLVRV